jgi:hypothetical protein
MMPDTIGDDTLLYSPPAVYPVPPYYLDGELWGTSPAGHRGTWVPYAPAFGAVLKSLPGVPVWVYALGPGVSSQVREGRTDDEEFQDLLYNFWPQQVCGLAQPWFTDDGYKNIVVQVGQSDLAGAGLWWQRSGYVAGPSEWETTPVEIATDRKSPSVLRLVPTQDALLASVLNSGDTLYVNLMRWAEAGYTLDTSIDTGVTALSTGGFWLEDDNTINLVYVDTSNSVQVISSTDYGATWA